MPETLRGQLLIAMPGMGDPRFERSVVFLCEHSDEGAMGLIVNKPNRQVRFRELVEQLELDVPQSAVDLTVHFGGPVEIGRGFVLHSAEYAGAESTLEIDGSFAMTATLDVIEQIARGEGPEDRLFALGYAGWGPGQLESEIQQNGWLTCAASSEIVFSSEDAAKWSAALKTLGVDATMLSAEAGRA